MTGTKFEAQAYRSREKRVLVQTATSGDNNCYETYESVFTV